MAIEGTFNLSQATTSQAYAYKCWYNYNYGGNTLNISASDMNEITKSWHSELSNWRANATNDENRYEIEDDDFSNAKLEGKTHAQEQTGYDGSGVGKMKARGSLDLVAAVPGAVINTAPTIGKTVGNAVKKVAAKVTGKKVTEETAKEGSKKAGLSAWITAGISIATAATYFLKKPNKEQKEACDELQNVMTDSQNALGCAQEDMYDAAEQVESLSDEANTYNEEANEEIEENKAEFDVYQRTYESLISKMESGETLDEDEKTLLKSLIPIMLQLNLDTKELQESTSDDVRNIFAETAAFQDVYDNSAETIAEVQGVTDFAESFDEATKTMCYVEAAAQGLNTLNGATSGARLCATAGLNIAQWVMGGAAIAAGVSSGFAAKEQLSWAGEVGTEIQMREVTQGEGLSTDALYKESIADYDGYMNTIEDLELEIPDDMEAPEEAPEIPTGENNQESTTTAGGFGLTPKQDENEKEKPEK